MSRSVAPMSYSRRVQRRLLALPIAVTVIWIAVQAFAAAQLGLRFGARVGEAVRERSEKVAGGAEGARTVRSRGRGWGIAVVVIVSRSNRIGTAATSPVADEGATQAAPCSGSPGVS